MARGANAEHAARWISKALSTITSNVFTKLTICFPPLYSASGDQARWWNSVDDVLGRFRPPVNVTLVMTARNRVGGGNIEDLAEKYFPSMWENGKMVLVL